MLCSTNVKKLYIFTTNLTEKANEWFAVFSYLFCSKMPNMYSAALVTNAEKVRAATQPVWNAPKICCF